MVGAIVVVSALAAIILGRLVDGDRQLVKSKSQALLDPLFPLTVMLSFLCLLRLAIIWGLPFFVYMLQLLPP